MVKTTPHVKIYKMLENNHREKSYNICYENFINQMLNEILSYTKK